MKLIWSAYRGVHDDELMPIRRYDVDLTSIYCKLNDDICPLDVMTLI